MLGEDACCVIVFIDLQKGQQPRYNIKKVHSQKVQLCLEDRRHQGVQSGPVREGEQKHNRNPDES